jgi:hypothetical protein
VEQQPQVKGERCYRLLKSLSANAPRTRQRLSIHKRANISSQGCAQLEGVLAQNRSFGFPLSRATVNGTLDRVMSVRTTAASTPEEPQVSIGSPRSVFLSRLPGARVMQTPSTHRESVRAIALVMQSDNSPLPQSCGLGRLFKAALAMACGMVEQQLCGKLYMDTILDR